MCATPGTTALPILSAKAHKQGCCSASDAADARRVADLLDIPFYALNFQDAFGRIKDYFADEYLAGRTPNPCVMCNNWLKFGKLWDFARQVDADAIATGHYAQLRDVPGEDRPALVQGADDSKDQSYVLFGIARDLLDRIIFPVGSYAKPRFANWPAKPASALPTSPTARRSASSPTTTTPPSSAAIAVSTKRRATWSTRPATSSAGTRAITISPSANAAA